MRAPDSSPRHSCECMCQHCATASAGYFAQRAALAGDATAAERLSAPVYQVLAAQRAKRTARKRRTEVA